MTRSPLNGKGKGEGVRKNLSMKKIEKEQKMRVDVFIPPQKK